MPTEYLGITPLTQGQTNKELTVNNADQRIEHATQRHLSVDFTSGDVALTDDQWTTNFLFSSANLGANQTLTVPTELSGQSANSSQRFFAVYNTDATFTIEVAQDGAGLKVNIRPGELAQLVADGTNIRRADATPFDVGSHFPSVPGNSEVLMRFVFTRSVLFPQDLVGSQARALVAATSQTDVDVRKNGSSVGTIRWAASGTVASFIFSTDQTFNAGDYMQVIGPGTADATLADLMWTLAGVRL